MDLVNTVNLLILTSILLVLFSASVSDWRKREISDRHWVILGIIGIAGWIPSSLTSGISINVVLSFAFLQLIILASLFIDCSVLGISSVILAIVGAAAFLLFDRSPQNLACASVLLTYLALLGMYYLGIVRGGADVKCLIVLSFSMPVYPEMFAGYSGTVWFLRTVFPPSISVLFLASILSVSFCAAYCFCRNIGKDLGFGDRVRMFSVPVSSVGSSFVWPAKDVCDGELTNCGIPDDTEVDRICQRYKDAGLNEMYVTPMIPFIIPITLATLVIVFLGNPLFIL